MTNLQRYAAAGMWQDYYRISQGEIFATDRAVRVDTPIIWIDILEAANLLDDPEVVVLSQADGDRLGVDGRHYKFYGMSVQVDENVQEGKVFILTDDMPRAMVLRV